MKYRIPPLGACLLLALAILAQGCGKKGKAEAAKGAPSPGASADANAGKKKPPVYIPPPGGIPAPSAQRLDAVPPPVIMMSAASTPEWTRRVEAATAAIGETCARVAEREVRDANENPAFQAYAGQRDAVERDASLSPEEKARRLTRISAVYQEAETLRLARLEDPAAAAQAAELVARLRRVSSTGPREEIVVVLEKIAALGDKVSANRWRSIQTAIDQCRDIHPRVGQDIGVAKVPDILPPAGQ